MKLLPKTLKYFNRPMQPEMRAALSKRLGDGLARIVYGVTDAEQPLPHGGLVFKDREIVGWIMKTHLDERDGEAVGDEISTSIEFFWPAPKGAAASVTVSGESHPQGLPVLARARVVIASDSGRTTTTRIYDDRTVRALVNRIGLLEVVTLDMLQSRRLGKFDPQLASVLMPTGDGWESEFLSVARLRACGEARTPAFWDMPVHTETHRFKQTALRIETVARSMQRESGFCERAALVGAVKITATWLSEPPSALGPCDLIATRNKSDGCWTVTLTNPANAQTRSSATYSFVGGDSALALAMLVLDAGELMPSDAVIEDSEAARSDFERLLYDTHQRRRQLQFVFDALGMDAAAVAPPPAPRPASQTRPALLSPVVSIRGHNILH